MYLKKSTSTSKYHDGDPIVKVERLSSFNSGSLSGVKIGLFSNEIHYIDYDWDDDFNNEVVIGISHEPEVLLSEDRIMRAAPAPIGEFNTGDQFHQYLNEPNSENDGLDPKEPIFSLNQQKILETGSLDEGGSQLLRSG
ncbi:MAG: hypothetical protein ABEI86_05465, partial [Halobacteriaceae archaeon]